jgi:hypothetical protein
MEDYVMSQPPKLIVKFWPASVTAHGLPAIKAIEKPLAFAMYARPFVTIATSLILGWQVISPGVGVLRRLMGF